jgi:hypothetical protein
MGNSRILNIECRMLNVEGKNRLQHWIFPFQPARPCLLAINIQYAASYAIRSDRHYQRNRALAGGYSTFQGFVIRVPGGRGKIACLAFSLNQRRTP